MIGVIANPADREIVREFFELFKTPWEFWQKGQRYEVLLCVGDCQPQEGSNLVILYAGRKTDFDDGQNQDVSAANQQKEPWTLAYREKHIPIYGSITTFAERGTILLTEESSGQCVGYLDQTRSPIQARIGYDLFSEIRHLLSAGQPAANASTPSLELHIAFLRDLITGCGVSLAEIPPVPEGFQFIACLTHDVDHPSIRNHKWDHTTFGFLSRALFGSFVNLVRGRMSMRDAAANWIAAIKLPFVHIGLAKDFWRQFADAYLDLEKALPSTFFLIPFKNRAGKTANGVAPPFRAVQYEARELEGTIRKLTTAGCEIALHGIDAWLDGTAGQEEIEEIRRLTGNSEIGVRMHWLYFNENAPKKLEQAGAAYDSTVGYNETVGFRAGTTQAYKPLGVARLLELPLHAMDTALFYPSHLGLSRKEATARLTALVDVAAEFGGCLTINWHDRSLAPERLWGGCYRDLIHELKNRGAWFATAREATAWFQKRRSAIFETQTADAADATVKLSACHEDRVPGLRLRIHSAQNECGGLRNSGNYADGAVEERIETGVASEAR